MNIPMSQVCENVIVRNKIGIPTILGQGARHSELVLAEMCYLYRGTRLSYLASIWDPIIVRCLVRHTENLRLTPGTAYVYMFMYGVVV